VKIALFNLDRRKNYCLATLHGSKKNIYIMRDRIPKKVIADKDRVQLFMIPVWHTTSTSTSWSPPTYFVHVHNMKIYVYILHIYLNIFRI